MRSLKATVIGAGSTYTPELIEGAIDRRESLNFQEFHLMDIDMEKLKVVGGLAERMLRAKGFKGQVVLTQDLDSAISGADYIFAQIRVGGMPARILDEKIPLSYGLLGQETTGAGGFMKALRTVPVMLDIARRVEKLAPDAWLINFSNPSGIVAEALLNNSNVKMIGLCNCPINMLTEISEKLGCSKFEFDYVGLNHLSWITSVKLNGKDVLYKLNKSTRTSMKNVPDVEYDDELLAAIPAIPSSYLSYYYLRDEQVKKCLYSEKSRGEACVEIEKTLMEKYMDLELSEKPPELAERGGALYSTAAISVVDAIENDKGEYHVVNVKNNGAIEFMGNDDVIEVKCLINREGAKPVKITESINPYISGLMRAVKAYEKLAVNAAIYASRADALVALMVHPLIGDYSKAKPLLDEMLEANRKYLPQGML